MIISLTGKAVNFPIDLGNHFPPLHTRNPLASNFLTISRIGAVIQRLPTGILLFVPPFLLSRVNLLEAMIFIKVPRNLALPDLALVISVFSTDNSSLRV